MSSAEQRAGPSPSRSPHPFVRVAAGYAWRLLVMAGALAALIWLTGQLLLVVLPVFAALLLARALTPCRAWLTGRGFRSDLAASGTLLRSSPSLLRFLP